MLFIYNIFIQLYYTGIRIASLWNKKADKWLQGRKDLFSELAAKISKNDRIVWIHCSSAGEFEQGKPIIEALKHSYPGHKILVSFFSPSGYSTAQNYAYADFITYMPLDTPKNARAFIQLVRPEIAIFVKYEFWYHHLAAAAFHHIPIILVSGVFRKEQVFFRKYGQFFRAILFLFRHIFVQDKDSLQLLHSRGILHSSISGDTRFDRVDTIAKNFTGVDFIKNFIDNKKVMVAGSTWEGDETLLSAYIRDNSEIKLILAPHEINGGHISNVEKLFPRHVRYSFLSNHSEPTEAEQVSALQAAQVLIIDSVGLLSRLYHYATVSYVGGGFTKDGIHNILEAAVWGKPVIFGPNYRKYREAKELLDAGGGYSISNLEELKKLADQLFNNEQFLQAAGLHAKNYVTRHTGATHKILQVIQEKRLLTN